MVKLPSESVGNFEKAPAGNHLATCYEVIDLGTQKTEYEGEVKHQRKIWIGWELPNELMEDGRPHVIGRRYTLSSHEKSTLRKNLESWRGKAFSKEDFGEFEITNVVGVACFLNVVHNEKGDRTYANIQAVAALPKGTPAPPLINKPVKFDLDSFDQEVFDSLSDRMKETIAESPEFQAIHGKPVNSLDEADDEDSPF